MATIRQIVQSSVASITDAPVFMWGTPEDLNIRLDNVSKDTAVLMLPKEAMQKDGFVMKMNKIPLTHIVSMAVVKQSELDDDYEDTRAVILEEMEALSLEILSRIFVAVKAYPGTSLGRFYLTELDKFGMEGISGYFNTFDANFDGLQLTLEIDTNDLAPVCFEGSESVTVTVT